MLERADLVQWLIEEKVKVFVNPLYLEIGLELSQIYWFCQEQHQLNFVCIVLYDFL